MTASTSEFDPEITDDLRTTREPVREALLRVATECFYERGYHGTSVRDITGRAGVTPAALYHYFDSKQDLLVALTGHFMTWSIALTTRAVLQAGDDPAAGLVAAVRAHVSQHTRNVAISFVVNSELRSLTLANRTRSVAQRDQLEKLFAAAVETGTEQGMFLTPFPHEASRAVVTMCTAVASWYRLGGELSPDQVCDQYANMALALVRATPETETRVGLSGAPVTPQKSKVTVTTEAYS